MVLINPQTGRNFAEGTGKPAKTDKSEAQVLAPFAAALRSEPCPVPDRHQQLLNATLQGRWQVVKMIGQEKNPGKDFHPGSKAGDQAPLTWLPQHLAQWNGDLNAQIRRSPLWRERHRLLPGIPGVGPVVSPAVMAQLPEAGTLPGKKAVALIVAPYNRDSRRFRDKRLIGGGRRYLRRILYMAAVVAFSFNLVITNFYQGALAAGKPKKYSEKFFCGGWGQGLQAPAPSPTPPSPNPF